MSRISVHLATLVALLLGSKAAGAAPLHLGRVGSQDYKLADTLLNLMPNTHQSPLERELVVSDEAWTNARSVPYLLLHGRHLNFLFCMIPKNACSEFLSLAMRLDGMPEEHWNLPAHGHQQQYIHFDKDRRYLYVSSQEELNEALTGTTVSAVFLRDPVARLLSAYRSKVMEGYFEASKGWSRTIRFEDFVKRLAVDLQKNPLQDPHLRPQSFLCGLNQTLELYDFVGDFDKLDEDAHQMVGQFFGGKAFATKILDEGWGANRDQPLFGVSREKREGHFGMSSTGSEKDRLILLRTRQTSRSKLMQNSYVAEKEFIQAKLKELKNNPQLESFIKDMYQMDYELIRRARAHRASLSRTRNKQVALS